MHLPLFQFDLDHDPNQIERAVDAIIESNKPVIYAGGGAINSNASEELIRLNEILDFPVTNTLMGLGVYPATHELQDKHLVP